MRETDCDLHLLAVSVGLIGVSAVALYALLWGWG